MRAGDDTKMASLLVKDCRLYDAPRSAPLCSVLVEEGTVKAVGDVEASVRADNVLSANGCILAPGFIDVHIQGAGGADVLDATPEALETISRTCARFGVTGFLATTVYRPGRENRHLRVAAECTGRDLGGARLLGLHLESPFISPAKRGMILPECVVRPAMAILEEIYTLLGDSLRLMVIAPEVPGNLDMIRELVHRGAVACLGHSNATYDDARSGMAAGISHVTHLFNAMPSMHHRDPGPLGAIFETETVTCQLITDGVHIHPSMVRLAFSALGPSRIVTITDGMQAMGLPDGRYVYNGVEYEARDGAARYEDGTLIGTALGLNQMLARLVDFTGCSVVTAINTVTQNPARILGMHDKTGSIAPGQDADLVVLDEDFTVHATIVAGEVIYRR